MIMNDVNENRKPCDVYDENGKKMMQIGCCEISVRECCKGKTYAQIRSEVRQAINEKKREKTIKALSLAAWYTVGGLYAGHFVVWLIGRLTDIDVEEYESNIILSGMAIGFFVGFIVGLARKSK